MKKCFFCLENIHESAEACGYCGNWQPNADEISSAWKAVLRDRVGLPIAPFLVFFAFFVFLLIPSHKVESSDAVLLVWAVVPYVFANNMYRQRRDIYVFENAVELDQLLQQKLMSRQFKRPRSLKSTLVIFGILILLAVSNPSTQEFQAYYAQKEEVVVELKDVNRTNLVIFSRYQVGGTDKTYWGVLGNFF